MQGNTSVPVISCLVKPWGNISTAELWNACDAANAAQSYFEFKEDHEVLPLNLDSYLQSDGGFDLDTIVSDMLRKRNFKLLSSNNLILITDVPYSEKGASPKEGYDFGLSYFFNEVDVLGNRKVSIISTYLWDHFKLRPDISTIIPSASGRRSREPYLLLSLAVIALDKVIRLETHAETLACPSDYCDDVRDIDAFFERGRWFCEKYCDPTIRKALISGKMQKDQLKAIKRLLNRSLSRPANDGYDSCFIAYGKPNQRFARKLYNDLRARNVESWIYDEDSLPGDSIWRSIHEARHLADRFLIICSKKSLKRSGLLKELETQIDENPDKLIPIALDELQSFKNLKAGRGTVDLMPYLRTRTFADFAAQPYNKALERLLKALHWK